ncbi:hypothetical protein D9758_003939 [Tetrapyrgos nigripes]|uniref:Cytochrome P450 n=1 Tax=Tetrapyrgos nigripes TaxID=182062 RepID=A0A8H5GL82_9AGAR|nr:hypothetical protein D9758_003939 [Tetrapyrgos nigripes]
MASPLLIAVLSAAVWVVYKLLNVGKREQSLPGGPPTLPLLGNLNVFPTAYAHYKFTEWAREYGDIYSLKLGPQTAVILTSMQACKELLDQQSAITSDRPASWMVNATSKGLHLALTRYSDTWRTLRKVAHSILTPNAVVAHQPIQVAEATQLMYDMLHSPEKFYTHIRRYSTSVIVSVVFGKRCPRYETPDVTTFFELVHISELCFEPGAEPPLEHFPFLHYVPERWARWKRLAKALNEIQIKMYMGLLDECEERLRNKQGTGCYLENVIEKQQEYGISREAVAYLGGALLEAGAHTTSAFLHTVIMCLIAFPDVKKKAQEEIDRVVGEDRTPRMEDFEDMPYVRALIKETHRFRPVAPLALPHALTADVSYRGYTIPKGTIIFANTWGIYHDPEIYDDPETFKPERFLSSEYGVKPGVSDKDFRHTLVFGYGRRICPGMHLANNSIELNVLNFLWAFEFSPPTDPKTGSYLPVDTWAYEKGVLPAPLPFPCEITPRSASKASMIDSEYLAATEAFSKFEHHLCEEDKEWLKATREKH